MIYRKILVPVDDSEPSTAALHELIKIAADRTREIRLLHVVDSKQWTDTPPGSIGDIIQASLREAGKRILKDAEGTLNAQGIHSESALLESRGERAAAVIVSHAHVWLPDLIVMGTHGRRGLGRLILGSLAADVVRTAIPPVLLVRGRQTCQWSAVQAPPC